MQVRNFKWLGFRVPFSIVNQANQANQLYPHAVSLMESIKTYELMCQKVLYMCNAAECCVYMYMCVCVYIQHVSAPLLFPDHRPKGCRFSGRFPEV